MREYIFLAGGGQIGLLNRGLAQVHLVAEASEVDLHPVESNFARDLKTGRVGFAQGPFGSADFEPARARRGPERGQGGTEGQRRREPRGAPDHLTARRFGKSISQRYGHIC